MDFISLNNWVRAVRSEMEWFLGPWSLGSSDWGGSGAVLLSVCPILDGPMHCLIAAKIGKNHRRVFFCLAYLCFWWEKLLWSMSLCYKYYHWPCMVLSEGLPPKTRRLVFWLVLFWGILVGYIFPWPRVIFFLMWSKWKYNRPFSECFSYQVITNKHSMGHSSISKHLVLGLPRSISL